MLYRRVLLFKEPNEKKRRKTKAKQVNRTNKQTEWTRLHVYLINFYFDMSYDNVDVSARFESRQRLGQPSTVSLGSKWQVQDVFCRTIET
jgi:hypothetical protein